MIQLDSTAEKKFAIKLDDYDGTSNPELVQNGDFSQVGANVIENYQFEAIGSELVTNGDFSQEGSELITNGDFSAIGSDLITNGDFTATGSELIVNGNFESGSADWTVNEYGSDTVTFATNQCQIITDGSGGTGIRQTILTIGKSYKVVIDIASNTNKFAVKLGNGIAVVSGSGVQTFYGVATSDEFLIYRELGEATDVVLNSVTVKELGEDWSVLGVSVPEFNASGVTLSTSYFIDATIYQLNKLDSDTSYKVTYTIASENLTDAVLQYWKGSWQDLPEQGVGTHTFYFKTDTVTGANDNWYFQLEYNTSSTDDVTISYISLQELGEDWSVQQGWSIGENKAICDGTTSNYVSQALSLPVGNVKVTFQVDSYTSGTLNLWANLPAFTNVISATAADTYEVYITTTSGANNIYFYSVAFVGSITNVSIKELGEDWTVYTDDDGGVEFNSQGVKITNGALDGQAKISQSSVFESGKSYKFTYTIVEYNGGDIGLTGQSAAMSRDVGTHVEYIVGGATADFILGKANTNTDVTVTDISVKQLDPADEWTLGTGAAFGSGGLVISGGDGNVATQPSIPNVTKAYELTFTVANYVQGNIYGIVSETKGANVTSNGTHYQYLVGTSGTVTGLGCSSSFIGDVTSMFVKQIDPDDDWILTNTGGQLFITTDPSDSKGNYVSSLLGSSFKQTKFLIEKNTEYTAEFEIPSMSSGILAWYTSDGVTLLSDNYVSAASKYTFNFEGNDTYGFMIQAVKITGTTATIKNVSVKRRYAGEVTLRFINQLTEKETVVNLTPDTHDERCAIFTYQATDFIEGMYLIKFSGGGGTYAESLAYISKGSTPLSESEYKEYTTGDDSPDHVYIPR
jgi:hypothetical protein